MEFATVEEIQASGKLRQNVVKVFRREDGMGNSVCALQDLGMDEVVCTYFGRSFVGDVEVPESDYLLHLKNDVVIDGNPNYPESVGHIGIFINDACGPINNGETNNVRFSVGWIQTPRGRKRVIWIRTKRKIAAGEELFLSYGRGFWKQ